jgi:hypothetical protein
MSSNTLLITVQQLKDRTGLHSNVDEKQVIPDIKYCQDAYIMPLLGTALMNKLQEDIEGETGKPTGDYLTLWENYLLDALCYYVLGESPMTLTYQLYNKGLVKKTSENTVTPDVQEIIQMADKYKKRAEWYGQRMADYLLENYTLFPEYREPGSGVDVFLPDTNAYQTSFSMGDDCGCDNGSYLPVSDSKFKRKC